MKKIKIKFVDFWSEFQPEKYWLWDFLRDNYNVEISEQPEYVFASAFGNEVCNYPEAIHILCSGEPFGPNWNVYDYALSYNKMEYEDCFFWMPPAFSHLKEYYILGNRENVDQNILEEKEFFCNFIYRDSVGQPERREIFEELSKYRRVESTGTWLNNQNPVLITHPGFEKYMFQKKCKFSIAVESTSLNGFLTEKIFDAFINRTIPIYYGDPLIEEIINPEAFINVRKYKNYDALIEHVKEIDENDELYLKMINQPVWHDMGFLKSYEDKRTKFLKNIFDQEYSKAFRRPRFYAAKRNENDLKMVYKIKKEWGVFGKILVKLMR